MAMLDALYIWFKSIGAPEVIKDEKKIEKATDDLQKKMTATQKVAEGLGTEFINIARNLVGVTSAALAAAAVIHGLKSSFDATVELSKTANLLGVNITELDAWGQAVTKAGGSAAAFQQSLHALAANLNTTPQVALKALRPLADAFHRLGRFRALQYGKKFGIDESTILLLARGGREVDALLAKQREHGLVTKHEQEVAQELTRALNENQQAFGSLFRVLGTEGSPTLTLFLDRFTKVVDYLREHKDFVIGAFYAISAAGAVFAAPFIAANASVIVLIASLTALIGTLALVYDDFQTFKRGGESLIGDDLKELRDKNKPARSIFDYVSKRAVEGLPEGKLAIAAATASPIAAQSSSSIINGGASHNNEVNINEINIQTQATDPEGIKDLMQKGFNGHFWQANNQFANGVVA